MARRRHVSQLSFQYADTAAGDHRKYLRCQTLLLCNPLTESLRRRQFLKHLTYTLLWSVEDCFQNRTATPWFAQVLGAQGQGSKPWPVLSLRNMSTSRNAIIAAEYVQLRTKLWPDIKEEDLWPRTKQTGFTIMPRTMPLILQIMDCLAKGKPVSRTYLDLWCRAHNENVVKLEKHAQMAFYAGYRGERREQAWKERLRELRKLGFIDVKPGANGEFTFALILNPHAVIKKHNKNGNPCLPKDLFNTLIERGGEIKAKDL